MSLEYGCVIDAVLNYMWDTEWPAHWAFQCHVALEELGLNTQLSLFGTSLLLPIVSGAVSMGTEEGHGVIVLARTSSGLSTGPHGVVVVETKRHGLSFLKESWVICSIYMYI